MIRAPRARCDECGLPKISPWSTLQRGYFCARCRTLNDCALRRSWLRLALEAHDKLREAHTRLDYIGAREARKAVARALRLAEKAITVERAALVAAVTKARAEGHHEEDPAPRESGSGGPETLDRQ